MHPTPNVLRTLRHWSLVSYAQLGCIFADLYRITIKTKFNVIAMIRDTWLRVAYLSSAKAETNGNATAKNVR